MRVRNNKRNDHRNLSNQLQRFTADAIAKVFLDLQTEGVASIPPVDALICQEKDRQRVCEVIGKRIFEATGVCCSVGGVRYSPLTEMEKQALAFDEIAPSGDGMTYDEWEEMRTVKTAAVLKLTVSPDGKCSGHDSSTTPAFDNYDSMKAVGRALDERDIWKGAAWVRCCLPWRWAGIGSLPGPLPQRTFNHQQRR